MAHVTQKSTLAINAQLTNEVQHAPQHAGHALLDDTVLYTNNRHTVRVKCCLQLRLMYKIQQYKGPLHAPLPQ